MQTVLAPAAAPGGMTAAGANQRGFNPYTNNGGSILAVAGQDFCVLAGDTRQSEGYNIQTRYKPRVFRLNDRATLATNGFAADAEALVQLVRARLELYRSAHGASMPLAGVARMLCTILYGKRFFPYYVWNVLGGLDEEGKGAVYTFDPVGSYEREVCRAAGAAQSLLQPFLDSQVMYKNQQATPERPLPIPGHISLRHAISIATDSFTSATERHIEVGDGLEIFVVRDPKAKTQTKEDEPMAAAAAGAALVDVPPPAGQLDLLAAPFNAAEAQGGEDDQSPGATLVIRRELKKD